MEPTEIQEFSSQLKEANEGGEKREQGESLTNISLAISILAVLVSMVTVLGHRTHTEAVLSQARASDQWAEYQAQKIRSDNTMVAIDLLHLQPSSDSAAVDSKIREYNQHIEKWREQLKEETAKAHELEGEVVSAERKAGRFDLGEALLQIAVVLCSVTLFTRQKGYFYFGLSLGLAGVVIAATAFTVH